MILDIIGDIPAKEGLILKVNGVEKELNMANKKIRFQLPDNEEHMVYFKQKKRRYRNPAVSLLIFLPLRQEVQILLFLFRVHEGVCKILL